MNPISALLTVSVTALTLGLATPALADGDLYLYTWADYTSQEMIDKFEKETGINVIIDTFASNDALLAKMKLGGTHYDIIAPGDYLVAILIKEGLLQQVEPNKLPNFKNVEPQWADVYWDRGRHYTIPLHWGTTSFQVNTEVFKGNIDTLGVLFDPSDELKGRINMLNDVNEVMNMGLRYLGLKTCNENPDDLRKVQALLKEQKQWVKSYSNDPKELIGSGEVAATMHWNGYAYRGRLENPSLKYAYPKEGLTAWMDNLAVPVGAQNVDNAMTFMNFMMDPKNIALNSNSTGVANGIAGSSAYMDPSLAQAPEILPPDNAPKASFVPPCNETVVGLYDRIWTDLLK